MAQVFISHRSCDLALAEKLALALKEAGHTVWLDSWELAIGDSLIDSICSGLAGATDVVVCYSKEGIESPWMSREWQSSLARQLNGRGVKLRPVRLSGGSPPHILDDIKYADLAEDWASGLENLLRALG